MVWLKYKKKTIGTKELQTLTNNLKRFENIPGAPTRRRGEWIWLIEPLRTSPKFATEVKT